MILFFLPTIVILSSFVENGIFYLKLLFQSYLQFCAVYLQNRAVYLQKGLVYLQKKLFYLQKPKKTGGTSSGLTFSNLFLITWVCLDITNIISQSVPIH